MDGFGPIPDAVGTVAAGDGVIGAGADDADRAVEVVIGVARGPRENS
jgi:hypothetical protein